MTSHNDEENSGLSLHVGPISAGQSIPVDLEALEDLILPHLSSNQSASGLRLVSGVTGNGKSHAIIAQIEHIQGESAMNSQMWNLRNYVNPLLRKAIERESDLIIDADQVPNFQEDIYSQPVELEECDATTKEQAEGIVQDLQDFLPKFTYNLRYVLNNKPFEVHVTGSEITGRRIAFRALDGEHLNPNHDRVIVSKGGRAVVFGDQDSILNGEGDS